jgi:hypothetical protein
MRLIFYPIYDLSLFYLFVFFLFRVTELTVVGFRMTSISVYMQFKNLETKNILNDIFI